MVEIIKNTAALIKVKTIVTLILISVFAVLALKGAISPDDVKDVVLIVVGFYFGTQLKESKPNTVEQTDKEG